MCSRAYDKTWSSIEYVSEIFDFMRVQLHYCYRNTKNTENMGAKQKVYLYWTFL